MKDSITRLEAIFNTAKELLSAEQREVYLRDACKDAPDLRSQVEALLRASQQSVDAFRTKPSQGDTILAQGDIAEGPGSSIGRYKLLQKIGEGGMGAVFMAEQTAPVQRKVALKIIKLGMDTKSVVARFEAERQALALMDHPNIAKVLDAGSTETGRPYFVMELVKGVPISTYCDKNQLATKERLELFIQVCQSIQHAHQKGVIHRDIKPSNILVTLHDGKPVPKVIDFGIAKATNQRLTEKTLFTNFAQMIGTPAYMSPEQAEMSGLDVDTRTDVYSLGVLLYELLTGTTPFPEKELLSKGYGEMQRIIAEQEPDRPSLRISTLVGEQQSIVAKSRAGELPLLSKQMRGDLDWIVMKALEKDRTRRYESANGMAEDIRRHLEDEPVLAAKPTIGYQFAKLYHRHKPTFAAAAGIAAAMVVGTAVATSEAISAKRAEEDAVRARTAAELAAMSEQELRVEAQRQQAKAESLAEARRLDAYIGAMNSVDTLIQDGDYEIARDLLAKQRPDVEGQEDLRGFEWRYLWEASADRSGRRIRIGSSDNSFNGRWMVASNNRKQLVLQDRKDGLAVLNAETLEVTRLVRTDGNLFSRAAFSPDDARFYAFVQDTPLEGRRGSKVYRSSLHVYNTQTWTVEARLPNAYPPMNFTESGAPVFRVPDEAPKLVDPHWNRPPLPYAGPWSHATFEPIANGGLRVVPVFENLPQIPVRLGVNHGTPGIAAIGDLEAKEWGLWSLSDSEGAKKIRSFPYGNRARQDTIDPLRRRFAFVDIGARGVWGLSRRVRLFDIELGVEIPLNATMPPENRRGLKLAFSEDGSILVAAVPDLRKVWSWDANSGDLLGEVGWHGDDISDMAIAGRTLFCLYADGEVAAWDLNKANSPRVPWTYMSTRVEDFESAQWETTPSSEIAAFLSPEFLEKARLGVVSAFLPAPFDGVFVGGGKILPSSRARAVSPDGRYLYVQYLGQSKSLGGSVESKPTIAFYELAGSRDPIVEWQVAPVVIGDRWRDGIKGMPTFVSNTQLLYENVAPAEGRVELWDLDRRTRKPLNVSAHLANSYSVMFHAADIHGDVLALGVGESDKSGALLWSASEDRPLGEFQYGRGLRQVEFSPDGKLVVLAGQERSVLVFDVEKRSLLYELRGHQRFTHGSFAPDGRTLMTEDDDGLRFWNLATGRRLVRIDRTQLDSWWQQGLRFTNDGESIYGVVGRGISRHSKLRFLTPRSLEEIDAEIERNYDQNR